MNITSRVPGDRTIMAIECKYNCSKFLGFIFTEGDVSTEPGDTCLSCLPDLFLIFCLPHCSLSLDSQVFKCI